MERALFDALSQWRVSRCEQLALNIDALHELLVRARPQFEDARWGQVCSRRRRVRHGGLPFQLERLQVIDPLWDLDWLFTRLKTARSLTELRAIEVNGVRWTRA